MNPKDLSKLDVMELWELWAESRSQPLKDELVVRYIPLVEQVAERMRMGLPRSLDINELINTGVIGLISAVDNFEPERGFRFETYASTRIRGSILDGLREYDWMPRSIRTKTRQLENALVKLEGELARIPTDEEVAQELKISLDDYYSLLDTVHIASILSLDDPIMTDDGMTGTFSDMVEDEKSPNPVHEFEWSEAKKLVKDILKKLNQQERLVIALYYYEELNLREIGEVLGISESRISQIHSRVIITIKGTLRNRFRFTSV